MWAGAAFKSPDASSAVRIAAVSFDIMPRRRRCLLCGEHHEESSSCACPRCHEFHAGGDASCLSCAICGCWHAQDDCQNAFVAKCCKMCGDPHDPHRPCPCPYCHYWHAGGWRVLICDSNVLCSRVLDGCEVFSNAFRRPRLSSLYRRF